MNKQTIAFPDYKKPLAFPLSGKGETFTAPYDCFLYFDDFDTGLGFMILEDPTTKYHLLHLSSAVNTTGSCGNLFMAKGDKVLTAAYKNITTRTYYPLRIVR